jgi:hypothetical protein
MLTAICSKDLSTSSAPVVPLEHSQDQTLIYRIPPEDEHDQPKWPLSSVKLSCERRPLHFHDCLRRLTRQVRDILTCQWPQKINRWKRTCRDGRFCHARAQGIAFKTASIIILIIITQLSGIGKTSRPTMNSLHLSFDRLLSPSLSIFLVTDLFRSFFFLASLPDNVSLCG